MEINKETQHTNQIKGENPYVIGKGSYIASRIEMKSSIYSIYFTGA